MASRPKSLSLPWRGRGVARVTLFGLTRDRAGLLGQGCGLPLSRLHVYLTRGCSKLQSCICGNSVGCGGCGVALSAPRVVVEVQGLGPRHQGSQ